MTDTSNALVVIQNFTPEVIFKDGGAAPLLEAIIKEVKEFKHDLTTVKGRKEIASMAQKVARSKTYLDDLGKDLVSEIKKQSGVIDAERKKIRDTLDALKEEVRRPLTEFEEKEETRLQNHKLRVAGLESYKGLVYDSTPSSIIQGYINELGQVSIDDSWDEFKSLGEQKKNESMIFLKEKLDLKVKQDTEQAELEKLRKEKAEREQKVREEAIAKEAAEKAKIEAEAKAKRDAEEAELKKQAELKAAKEAQDKVEREKSEAIAKQKKAEEDAHLALERAEKEKIEAAKKAEEDKQRAIEAERIRVQNELKRQEEETKKREANLNHRKLINNEILTALKAECSVDEDLGKKIIESIARGQIPNIKVIY